MVASELLFVFILLFFWIIATQLFKEGLMIEQDVLRRFLFETLGIRGAITVYLDFARYLWWHGVFGFTRLIFGPSTDGSAYFYLEGLGRAN